MNAQIERAVNQFSEAMKRKMEIREPDKGGWDDVSAEWLYIKLGEEVEELAEALLKRKGEQVMEEAVDVANVAMMIYDKTRKRG